MLSQAIGDLLPSAVGVAISPAPIIAVILMLSTPKARTTGPAFALGWIAGLVVVSAVVLAVADGADQEGTTSDAVSVVKLVLGVVLFFLAVRRWRSRPRPGVEPEMPGWMQTMDRVAPSRAVGLGALLSGANPKNLALTLAAAASIAQGGLSTGGSVVAVAVFVVIGSATVAGPVAFYLLAPSKAASQLDTIKRAMSEHNAMIMCVVLVVLGAKLLGNGFAGLAA